MSKQDLILEAYEKALQQANEIYSKACKEAKEICLRALKEARHPKS